MAPSHGQAVLIKGHDCCMIPPLFTKHFGWEVMFIIFIIRHNMGTTVTCTLNVQYQNWPPLGSSAHKVCVV